MKRMTNWAFCRRRILIWPRSAIGAIRIQRNLTRKRKRKNLLLLGGVKKRRVPPIPERAVDRRIGVREVSSRFLPGKLTGSPGNRLKKSRKYWRRHLRQVTTSRKRQLLPRASRIC